MRPVTSPDMGDSGGSPGRRPKLALREGESLVFCESLLLGVILHPRILVSLCYTVASFILHIWVYTSPFASPKSSLQTMYAG